MNQHIKRFGAFLLMFFAVWGLLSLSSRMNDQAANDVDVALAHAKLNQVVRFGRVSASLLGRSLTLHDVEVRDDGGRGIPAFAGRLIVSDVKQDQGHMVGIRLRFKDLSLSVIEPAKHPKQSAGLLAVFPHSTRVWLLGEGYSTLQGSFEVSVNQEPDGKETRFDIRGDFTGFQSFDLRLVMTGTDRSTLDALVEALPQFTAKRVFAVMDRAPNLKETVSHIELKNFQFMLRDCGLGARLVPSLAEKYLIEGIPSVRAASLAESVKRDIKDWLKSQRTEKRLADEISTKLSNYVVKGEALSLTSHMEKPFPLFEHTAKKGVRPVPAILSVGPFVTLTATK